MEQETDLTATEIKEQRELQKREAELMRQTQQLEREEKRKMAEEAVAGSECCWGIGMLTTRQYVLISLLAIIWPNCLYIKSCWVHVK